MKDRTSRAPASAKLTAPSRRNAALGLAAVVVVGAVVTWLILRADDNKQSSGTGADPFTLPAITPSHFRNTSKTVAYVGTRECIECHPNEHQSYLHTTHSRSMGDVDVTHEPRDGEFRHDISGRSYSIHRDVATLKLREFITDSDGKEVTLVEHAAGYTLGSGNYSRMYLVKASDFLVEAPITWYPRRTTWGMSAGYEKDPHQRGFNRSIDAGCLFCHAGHVETIGGSSERLKVTEMAIGCERCHGPGELHVKERKAKLPVQGGVDDTIVNPRQLARELQEDICSQCHLSASADVAVRGRSKDDYRPGMRMSDFVVSYRIDRPDPPMTVSGQMQQMRLSKCYIESKTLSCITCHDPHSRPDELTKIDHHRNQCLSCHKTESCGLPVKTRLEKDAKDNCVACHMPRGPTDIPHFSFTHHRIGIHKDKPNDRLNERDQLIAVGDVSHFPEHERLRQLGLANDIFGGKLAGGLNDEVRYDELYRSLSRVFKERGRDILEDVRSRGLRDPEVEAYFSRINWRKDPARCIEHAELALQLQPIAPATRKSTVYNLATTLFDQGKYDQAFPYLEELVKSGRDEITMMLLAICHQKKGNLRESIRLVQEAIVVAPDRADLHTYLASIYRQMGMLKEAEQHTQRAKLLQQKVPQPG
jgi:hypothetical protein